MKPPRTITTERLTLRLPVAGDVDAVYAYASDPAVMLYLLRVPATDPARSAAFLERCVRRWETGDAYVWAITTDSDLLGVIEARPSEQGVELGYVLAQSAWGQGHMTEAVGAVTDWALREPGVHRVWAYTHVDNSASQRVLEKVGMTREGLLHRWAIHPNVSSEPSDVYVYAKWQ